jgi:hypothetical protein
VADIVADLADADSDPIALFLFEKLTGPVIENGLLMDLDL